MTSTLDAAVGSLRQSALKLTETDAREFTWHFSFSGPGLLAWPVMIVRYMPCVLPSRSFLL